MKTTTRRFWNVLKSLRGKFTIRSNHGIRTTGTVSGCICPVCAVANELIGYERFDLGDQRAATAIGLSLKFAEAIAFAADDMGDTRLRARLCATLGIKEKSPTVR